MKTGTVSVCTLRKIRREVQAMLDDGRTMYDVIVERALARIDDAIATAGRQTAPRPEVSAHVYGIAMAAVKAAAKRHGVTSAAILSPTRRREVTHARHVAQMVTWRVLRHRASRDEIAAAFNREGSTMQNVVSKRREPPFMADVEAVERVVLEGGNHAQG